MRDAYASRRTYMVNAMEASLGYAVLYTAVFLIYGSMEVLGLMPQELRSAGITLPSLLSRWFGDQVNSFNSNYSTTLQDEGKRARYQQFHFRFVSPDIL